MTELKEHFLDDGNWSWKYECLYAIPTNDPQNWVYNLDFETDKGGFLNGEAISCRYLESEKILKIYHNGGSVKFYCETIYDCAKIIKPMIIAHNAKPYPIYVSTSQKRKEKLKQINRNTI